MGPGTPRWSAVTRACAADPGARVPFRLAGRVVGSVARIHLQALGDHRDALRIDDAGVELVVPPDARDATLARLNAGLRDAGLIRGWRDEIYPVVDPASGRRLARIERAASRFWGTLTFGAHANGWVAGPDGRPRGLWIARRSLDKATDPGLFDNLVGGGVPDGQTPAETLVREAWEEAGLPAQRLAGVRAGRVVQIWRDIPEGLQHERLHGFDIELPPGCTPSNQDGEVAGFELLPLDEALELAAGETMTVDAAVVTLDFALRWRVLPADEHEALMRRTRDLWLEAPRGADEA